MLKIGRKAIQQEAKGLQALAAKLDRNFEEAVGLLLRCDGTIILSGVGKSGQVARKLASTFTSLGSRAVFLHPTDAAHGDMGLVDPSDAIIVLSRSGQALELTPLVQYAWEKDCPIILISESDNTFLAKKASVVVRLPKVAEAWGHAPTTSTIMQMALGDALAVTMATAMKFTVEDFRRTHPGGVLNKEKTDGADTRC